MPTPKKPVLTNELSTLFEKSTIAILTEYRGMRVSEITNLRRKLLPTGTEYHVSKNTLSRRAVKGLGWEGLDSVLTGPSAIAFVGSDLVKGVKELLNFQKDSKVFKIKVGILGGKVIEAAKLEELTKLPTKEVLIAQLMGSLNAPASNLVSVLSQPPQQLVNAMSGVPRNLVNVLNQRKLQLEEQN